MSKLFDIQDTTVAIPDLTLQETRGSVTHRGDLDVAGNLNVASNIRVSGTLSADTFNVKNLVTDNGSLNITGNWIYNTELELNGKGFNWTHGTGQTQLLYRTGGRLWTNANLDIGATSSYNIDNIPVLSATTLGSSIRHSNLNTVGTLNQLSVSGDATLGDFVFVNSIYNKVGIGTEEPSASLTILDNNVEIGIGSPDINLASIGTHSNHDLQLITDGQPRVTIKQNGEVNVGDPVRGGGVLNVYGTLFATSVVTDNRVDRTHPIQFSATKDTGIYGLGLLWSGHSSVHQFVLSISGRLTSTESIEVASHRSYYIDGQPVLSLSSLGQSVTSSSLNTVGVLENLTVSGPTNLKSQLNVQSVVVNNGITLKDNEIVSSKQITLAVQDKEIVFGNDQQVNIGDIQLQSRPVKVYGPLSVNINNPDPSLQFSVNGDVSLGGKRFTNGSAPPSKGSFNQGDICWNSSPGPDSYIGWVCLSTGTPGQWSGFGMIASQ
jgi:hypothetical protein